MGKLNLINKLIVPVTYLDGQDIEIRVGDDDSDLGEHTIALSIDKSHPLLLQSSITI